MQAALLKQAAKHVSLVASEHRVGREARRQFEEENSTIPESRSRAIDSRTALGSFPLTRSNNGLRAPRETLESWPVVPPLLLPGLRAQTDAQVALRSVSILASHAV